MKQQGTQGQQDDHYNKNHLIRTSFTHGQLSCERCESQKHHLLSNRTYQHVTYAPSLLAIDASMPPDPIAVSCISLGLLVDKSSLLLLYFRSNLIDEQRTLKRALEYHGYLVFENLRGPLVQYLFGLSESPSEGPQHHIFLPAMT